MSSCCNGTGLADFAAVPCPNPSCPTKKNDLVTVLHVAFYGVMPDDLRLHGIMEAIADEVLNTGLPHPDITRESHTVPVRPPEEAGGEG